MEIQQLHIQRCSVCKKYLCLSETEQGLTQMYCDEHSQKTSTKNNQQKKDDEAIPVSHLETRSSMEEDSTWDCKTNDVDNHADTDDLTNPTLDVASRTDGCRLNPQDYSGQVSGTAKEDTGVVPFPADSKSKSDVEDS